MSRPANLRDIVEVIRRSRLIDDRRLADVLRDARSGESDAPSPDGLLNRLIADGLLTRFQADQLAIGRWKGFTIGSYKLLDKLGSGGMGRVFLAEHSVLGKRVAIKVLETKLAADPVARQRFTLEARAAAALDHPNIVHVIDLEADADPPYIVMEYVEGITLQAAVQKSGPLNPGTAAYCARQIALALQLAYEIGLVHRDIKPANLLIDKRGIVKVLDLGIVRIPGESLTMELAAQPILGTADYLAPEQAVDSSNVDTRADIYALGGTLYYLLSGKPPYADGSAALKLARKQVADPPWIGRVRPDVPEGLANVIHRMMARSPADRYPTPSLAAEALAPWSMPDSGFPQNLLTGQRSPTGDSQPRFSGPPSPPSGNFATVGTAPGSSPGQYVADTSGFGVNAQDFSSHNGFPVPGSGYIPGANGNGHGSGRGLPPGSVTWAQPASIAQPSSQVSWNIPAPVPTGPRTTPLAGTGTIPVVAIPAAAYHPAEHDSTLEMMAPTVVEPTPTRPRPVEKSDNTALWLAIGGSGLAFLAAVVTVYFFFFSNSVTPNVLPSTGKETPPATPPKIAVPRGVYAVMKKPADQPNVFQSVRDAMRAVSRPHHRIEIWDDTWEERLSTEGLTVANDLTITGRDGKRVVWRGPSLGPLPSQLPGQPPPQHPPLVSIPVAKGLRFENIEFDGGTNYHVCLQLGGENLTLRNLLVRGFLNTAFSINSTGSEETPNVIEDCRVGMPPGKASPNGAIRLTGGSYYTISNSRVEGQYLSCVAIEAPIPGIRIERNRFQGVLHYTRLIDFLPASMQPLPTQPGHGEPPQANPPMTGAVITRNVFADSHLGIQFGGMPATPKPDQFTITGNLFDRVSFLAMTNSPLMQIERSDVRRRWIWDSQCEPNAPGATAPRGFRCSFTVPENPVQASRTVLDIGSSGTVSIWVNGKAVLQDRCFGYSTESVDLTAQVKPGQNTLAVLVKHLPPSDFGVPAGAEIYNWYPRPCWTGRIRIGNPTATNGRIINFPNQLVTFAASKLWKVQVNPPEKWESPDFNDANWEQVVDVIHPAGVPYNSPILWSPRGDIARPGFDAAFKVSGNVVHLPTPAGNVYQVGNENLPSLRAVRLFFKAPELPRDPNDDQTFLRHKDSDVPEKFRNTFGIPRE